MMILVSSWPPSRQPSRASSFAAAILGLAVAWLVGLHELARADEPAPLASEWVKVAGSKVRLIGGGGYAGVEMVLENGWHTYWRSPGESGVPPSFDWSKSENLKSATVLYPAPIRIVDHGAANVGYRGNVTFPVHLEPVDPAKPITLKLDFAYGVCSNICVPAEAALALGMPPIHGPDLISREKFLWHQMETLVPHAVPVDTCLVGACKGVPWLNEFDAHYADKPHLTLDAHFLPGTAHQDAFVEGPEGVFLPLTELKGEIAADGKARYEVDLTEVDLSQIKGKDITVTLVSDAGNSETRVPLPP